MMYKDISFFLFHEAYSKIYAQFLRFWDFTTFIAYSIHIPQLSLELSPNPVLTVAQVT